LKREIRKEQLKPNAKKLDNASCIIVAFFKREVNKEYVSHPRVRKQINKHFWEVKVVDVDKSQSLHCETILGTKIIW
jgi:hypothetical protein